MTKPKSKILVTVILMLVASSVAAQTDRVIDEIIEQEKASFGNAVLLILAASGAISEEASVEDALAFLEQSGWEVRGNTANEPVELGDLCYVIMRSFEINGGLFYSLFPGPRYAPRELQYLGFFFGNFSAYRILSGEEVLRILGSTLAWKEEQS